MKCYDYNDSADLTVSLYRKDFITNQLEFVGGVHSGMNFMSPNIVAVNALLSGPLTKIGNRRYAWFLMCEFDQFGGIPMELHQVVINYSK